MSRDSHIDTIFSLGVVASRAVLVRVLKIHNGVDISKEGPLEGVTIRKVSRHYYELTSDEVQPIRVIQCSVTTSGNAKAVLIPLSFQLEALPQFLGKITSRQAVKLIYEIACAVNAGVVDDKSVVNISSCIYSLSVEPKGGGGVKLRPHLKFIGAEGSDHTKGYLTRPASERVSEIRSLFLSILVELRGKRRDEVMERKYLSLLAKSPMNDFVWLIDSLKLELKSSGQFSDLDLTFPELKQPLEVLHSLQGISTFSSSALARKTEEKPWADLCLGT